MFLLQLFNETFKFLFEQKKVIQSEVAFKFLRDNKASLTSNSTSETQIQSYLFIYFKVNKQPMIICFL